MSLQVALGISTTMTDMEEATHSKWTGGAINDSDETIQILSLNTSSGAHPALFAEWEPHVCQIE